MINIIVTGGANLLDLTFVNFKKKKI
jgi:hypothetical protein